MKTGKRYDDYLPGETRAQYVKRRAVKQRGTIFPFWISCLLQRDGSVVGVKGTFAGQTTQEYQRIKKIPQVQHHIKNIDAMFKKAA